MKGKDRSQEIMDMDEKSFCEVDTYDLETEYTIAMEQKEFDRHQARTMVSAARGSKAISTYKSPTVTKMPILSPLPGPRKDDRLYLLLAPVARL